MIRTIAIACAAAFSISSFAYADSVIIHETDPEPTNSVVIQERQVEPEVIVRKKKIIVEEQRDPDVIIRDSDSIGID
jgi:hypothetical protein